MEALLEQRLSQNLQAGDPFPLGATLKPQGVNFAVFSKYAKEVFLLLFQETHQDQPTDSIKLNRTGDVWHVLVQDLKAGQLYGYKADGEYKPGEGKRFNPYKLLIDPHAKAVSGKVLNQDNFIFPYDIKAQQQDWVMDIRENFSLMPKSIVIDDAFDWGDDKPPGICWDNLIIYEVHVKGFTAHPSSRVAHPGTYLGFIEKIPYLKKLGINAVELMPCHEFAIRSELIDRGLTDFWGYNTICFFAPEISYSTQTYLGCQVQEFKELVKYLHKAGIEVILDVVYNHTGEGNHLGPSLVFKGMDNPTYYALIANSQEPQEALRFYLNDSGCGNTLNIENPAVENLVFDSLRYWVSQMHVDGFRFDEATILGRVQGQFNAAASPFFERVSKDPVLSQVKMIVEPWDAVTYQAGHFPPAYSEWNAPYRDTARRFLKGDDGQAAEMAKRLTGSSDIYKDVHKSINFITAHDGFTLNDLFSYNTKHNQANQEDNRDGLNENYSWNCGVEGVTQDVHIEQLRQQMIKNAICLLMFSSGVPMILYGDEVMRTQKGNNNAYAQDNELTYFNWDHLKSNEIFDFYMKAIALRQAHPLLTQRNISWYGKHLDQPHWESPTLKRLSYQLSGPQNADGRPPENFFIIFNMSYTGTVVRLPVLTHLKWYRLIDTSKKAGSDFLSLSKKRLQRNQSECYCLGRSVKVLMAA